MTDRVIRLVLRGDVTGAVAGMRAYGTAVRDTANQVTAANARGREMQRGITTLGTSAGKIGLVAAVGFAAVIKSAADFDSAMSRVDAATHETSSNMELLRAAAIKAGADTVFSATEAADAITALSKAGVSTKDILSGGLSAALSLASAGELDVAQAADIAATALNQFGLGGDQANHVADLLAAGAGKAQGEVTDMAAALKYVGPVAHQMGISIEETSGAIAELASQGIIGEQAGTSLRGVLSSLTSPSKAASTEMEKLGINLYDAQGKFVGLKGVAGQLHDTMGTLTNAERDQALGRIFGNEQITAARILYAGGAADVEKWTKAVDDNGYAADTAHRKMDNLAGDFEQLKGSLSTLLITSGDGSQGPLRGIVQGATNATNALNGLPPVAKDAALGLLGITAVTGGGLWFSSKAIAGVSAMRGALAALGIQATTTRSLIATLGTAGVATGLSLGTFLDGLSILDSRSRSGAAADATVKSYQDLSDALAASNVGKYADDLHINLGRLTEDLLQNGTKGEYATKVLNDLSESSHGLGAGLKSFAGNVLPFYTASSDKAYDANKDLKNIIDESGKVLGSTAQKSLELADGTKAVGTQAEITAARVQESAAELKKLQDAAAETANSFFGLGKKVDDSKVSLQQWIRDLNKQASALRDFTKNAQTAGQKGLRDGLIQELEAAGPAGALRMKQLADGTEKEIARANRAWDRGQAAMDAYVKFVVPSKVVDVAVDPAVAAVNALKRLLGSLHDENIHVNVTTTTNATIGDAVANNGRNNDGTVDHDHNKKTGNGKADGGLMRGPGGPRDDLIPAWLSNGEFVMPADAVQHYGIGMLEMMRAKRLADGGGVGGRAGLNAYIRSDLDMKAPATLKQWNEALKASTALLAKEKDARQNLVDQANDVKSSIASKYQSDLFGQSTPSIWMSAADRQKAGVGDPIASLSGDIGNLKALATATKTLKAKGLDGAALADLLGNASLSEVQAFAGGSKAQVQQYEHLYNQRAGLIAATGNLGAQAAFGAQLAVSKAAVTESRKNTAALNRVESLLKKNPHATAVELARAINGAAPKRRS